MRAVAKPAAWLLAFFASANCFSAPIRHVIIEPEGVLFQSSQETPPLESTRFRWRRSNGKLVEETVYVRSGGRQLLESLASYGRTPKISVHFLSHMPQARLNALLKALRIHDGDALSLCQTAFGAEAVRAYEAASNLSRVGSATKDLGLVFHQDAQRWASSLKQGHFDIIREISANKRPTPRDALILDPDPSLQYGPRRSQALRIRQSDPEQLRQGVKEYFPPIAEVSRLQETSAAQDVARNQLRIVEWLIGQASNSDLPNPYEQWDNLLDSPRSLVIERTHFPYLIADLLGKIQSDTEEILILGRDTELFNEALRTVANKLGYKNKIIYASISRQLAAKESGRLDQVLRKAGVDVESIKSGTKTLRIVDNLFEGSVPKRIIRSLLSGDPNWRSKVKSIRTHLFLSASRGRDPNQFESLDAYLDSGAFLDNLNHEFRYPQRRLAQDLVEIEYQPKLILRTSIADRDARIVEDPSHPSERRAAGVLHHLVDDIFQQPQLIEMTRKRIDFLKKRPGTYPAHWGHEETNLDFQLPPVAKEVLKQFNAVLESNHDHGFVHVLRNGSPVDEYSYVRDIELDFPVQPLRKGIYPSLTRQGAEEIRRRSLQMLSRSAQGLHLPSNDTKDLAKYGNQLAASVIDAHARVNDILFKNLGRRFNSPRELESFVLSIATEYVAPVSELTFRQWAWSRDEINEPPGTLENDWHWFIHWFRRELNTDFDPFALAAKVHYVLARRIHPFYDGVGKVSRDLADFILMSRGLMPIEWAAQGKPGYELGVKNIESTYALILTRPGAGSLGCILQQLSQ